MGLFDDLAEAVGGVIGIGAGIALAPIAIALGITEKMVKEAIDAGCKTVEEIKEYWDLD